MDVDRRRRAEARRHRAVLRRVALNEPELRAEEVRGAEAISLVTQLTIEGWSLSGRPWPDYDRANTPYRFVPGWPE